MRQTTNDSFSKEGLDLSLLFDLVRERRKKFKISKKKKICSKIRVRFFH